MTYIIRKLFSTTTTPYAGPSCSISGVEKGRIYDSAEKAQTDCDKLNFSSVYFEVGVIDE